ncbi:MAG: hypothetical protein Q8P97_01475, partial [bacterium]|nr:hypothetical protein [bacterium]
MKIYDIRPPIRKEVEIAKKISLKYWRLTEKFIKHSRWGIPLLAVLSLFIAGAIISAITQTEIRVIRALPQAVSGDWQLPDNTKGIDLGENAQSPEFNRLNSGYPYQEFSELNTPTFIKDEVGAPTPLEGVGASATSSPNIDASTSASTTSFIMLHGRENFLVWLWNRFIPLEAARARSVPLPLTEFILGVKAQEEPAADTVPESSPPPVTSPEPAPTSAEPTPSPEPTTPTSEPVPPASEPSPELTPAPASPDTVSETEDTTDGSSPEATMSTSSDTTTDTSPDTSTSTTSETPIIFPNIDGVVSTDSPPVVTSTEASAETSTETTTDISSKDDYHLFANKKELVLQKFKLESAPDKGAKFSRMRLNLSLMMQGTPTSSDELLIEYSLDDSSWHTVTTLIQNKNYSNYLNDGYYSFDLPISASDTPNLAVKITALSDGETAEPIFLDAAWLAADYEISESARKESKERKILKGEINDLVDFHPDYTGSELPGLQLKYHGQTNFFSRLLNNPLARLFTVKSVTVLNPKGEEIELKMAIEYDDVNTDEWRLTFLERPENFVPGKYTVKISINESGTLVSDEQNFYWGVLAINSDRSTYLIDGSTSSPQVGLGAGNATSTSATSTLHLPATATAYIQLAALNDLGHTLCNANLKLSVTHNGATEIFETGSSSSFDQAQDKSLTTSSSAPLTSGSSTLLSISSSTLATTSNPISSTATNIIEKSGECKGDSVVAKPDYFIKYEVSDQGRYDLKLEMFNAVNEPIHAITNFFDVEADNPFDIERVGPTRIFPLADYGMSVTITARSDFSGSLTEFITGSYQVSD